MKKFWARKLSPYLLMIAVAGGGFGTCGNDGDVSAGTPKDMVAHEPPLPPPEPRPPQIRHR